MPASSARMLIPDQIDAAASQARRKPVVDTAVNGVQRSMGAVNRNASGRAAQQSRLDRVGQRYGGERFENGRMIRDDHGRR